MTLSTRRFRFGAQPPPPASASEWAELVKRAAGLGYSTVTVADHFDGPLGPFAALTAAAEVAPIRVGTFVLDNDFWHPAVLAREAATVDLLSDGRLELGLGAGWLTSDYERTGIPFDRPAVRAARLEESVAIVSRLLAGDTVTVSGTHYRVTDLAVPRPAQRPRPPLLVGGSRRRVLSLAGREADIVGLAPRTRADGGGPENPRAPADNLAERVRWAAAAAVAAGRTDPPELNALVFETIVDRDRRGAAERAARRLGLGFDAGYVLAHPHMLLGPVSAIVDDLEERRERFGISYWVVQQDMDRFGEVVARLTA